MIVCGLLCNACLTLVPMEHLVVGVGEGPSLEPSSIIIKDIKIDSHCNNVKLMILKVFVSHFNAFFAVIQKKELVFCLVLLW